MVLFRELPLWQGHKKAQSLYEASAAAAAICSGMRNIAQ